MRSAELFRSEVFGYSIDECIFLESTILAHVNHDLGNLRTKQKHYHERVPQERLDEYDSTRTMNADRK